MKARLVFLALIINVLAANSQTTVHQQAYWLRLYGRVKLNDKWSFQVEADERRLIKPDRQLQFIAHAHLHRKFGKYTEGALGTTFSAVRQSTFDVPEGRLFQEFYWFLPLGKTTGLRLSFGIDKLNVPRSDIPAVTHVDYSARIQTVHRDTNPRYYALLAEFERITGCPVLVNTSFNVRGEPIVGTPDDAFRCFMGTELDVLAVGNCYLRKENQDPALKRNYESAFELD